MFSDPLKLIPLLICVIAGAGLMTGKLTPNEVIGMLTVAGISHTAISSVNNVNPPK